VLAAGTLAAVLTFRSWDALAGAYGIAVAGLMAISTFLAALVAIRWSYNPVLVVAVNGGFFLLDLVFFAANAMKLLEGGWFPLLIAGVIAFLMLAWRTGVKLVEAARAHLREDETTFLSMLDTAAPCRSDGIGAFLSAAPTGVPLAMSHHVRHSRSLQKRLALVSVMMTDAPFVANGARATATRLAPEIDRVILRFGFMDDVNIPHGLACAALYTAAELDESSYYIGRERSSRTRVSRAWSRGAKRFSFRCNETSRRVVAHSAFRRISS
jgi:KUP system potassium uptake protein